MVDVKLLIAKYKMRVGYTLTALAIAFVAIDQVKPKIDNPDLPDQQRQLYGAGLVFLMVFLFGILKNFVWVSDEKPADAAPPEAEAITQGKEAEASTKAEAGKTRKRTPKM